MLLRFTIACNVWTLLPMTRSMMRLLSKHHWALLFLALILAIALAAWLVQSSRIYYFWDNRAYQQITFQAWQAMSEGMNSWIGYLRASLTSDYNALFTLPLAPMMALFGSHRLVYILSVMILYFFPLAILCGLIGRELSATRSVPLMILITFLVLSLAAPWLALLLGYPDFAAALALACAIYIYLKDPVLESYTTMLGIAFLIAATILLRRHFAYAGLAFYAASGLVCLAQRWHRQGFWQALLNTGWRIGLAAFASLIVMLLIAPEFTRRALLENYREVYSSYWQSLEVIIKFFGERLGLLSPLLALGGYLYAWRRRLLTSTGFAFINLMTGIWLLFWLILVRQNGPQYMLHVFPLWLGVGQGLLVYSLWHGRRWQQVLGAICMALIVFAFVNTFWLYRWIPAEIKKSLPDPVLPLSDHAFDYERYASMLNRLMDRMQNGERLYLAVSHGAMNRDVLLSAEEQLHGTHHLHQQIFFTADVDSRDWTPLPELLQADLIAVTVPFIPHLPPPEQDLIRAVMLAFVEAWPFSHDFERVEQFEFQALGGFQLKVYKRLRPTDIDTALDTFWRLRAHIEPAGWQQKSWINLAASTDWKVEGRVGEPAQINAISADTIPIRLAYYPMVSGAVTLQSRLEATGCSESRLELMTWNPAFSKTQQRVSLQDDMHQDWTVQFQLNDKATLVLALIPARKDCRVTLTDVRINIQK